MRKIFSSFKIKVTRAAMISKSYLLLQLTVFSLPKNLQYMPFTWIMITVGARKTIEGLALELSMAHSVPIRSPL